MNFRQAWLASPGPGNGREALLLAAKGFCMGSADIIPGVSGGTVAFITGIYEQLLGAVKSFNLEMLRRLFRLDLTGALAAVHLRFLAPLLLGIGLALVSMARLMHWLLANHPVHIWSLFFGLIAASVLVVGRRIGRPDAAVVLCVIAGLAGGYALVGLIPVETPEDWWFIFICGAVAICAMILPGISGAFILLILGKYQYVTQTLKNPFAPENMFIILVFGAGCAVGVLGFSRLLHYFLTRYRAASMALLTGLMAGAMRKVWPWKETLESKVAMGKVLVLREDNVMPAALDESFALAVGLMLVGFMAVLVLERMSGGPGK